MSESKYPLHPVLLVDDEPPAIMSNVIALSSGGIDNCVQISDSREVPPFMEEHEVSVVVLDLSMPHIPGDKLLPMLAEAHPETPVIILTGANRVETAVECMKAGAFDYLVKPVEEERLLTAVRHAIELREIRQASSSFNQRVFSGRLQNPEAFAAVVTRNPTMFTIFQYVESIAGTSQPVLITGETGVGKELIARAVHDLSGRKGPFVAENVAGLDDNVFSDTLFGHTRGAFTGADRARSGLVERASGGTLLLDEIGDLSTASQVKLLRLLQEREYFPLGSDVAKVADVRIVATTNRDTDTLRRDKGFRNDLFFRLKTHHIHIPPLRERREDIALLFDHFLAGAAREMGKTKPTPPRELYTLLATYHFPGNVRELAALVYDAVGRHTSRMLSMEVFKENIVAGAVPQGDDHRSECADTSFFQAERLPSIKEATNMLIEEALRRAKGNQSIAARLLGITPSALNKRLKRLGEED